MLQLASLGVSPRCREASFSSVRLEIELLGWRREELGLGGHCMLFVGIIDYVGCDCCLFVCLFVVVNMVLGIRLRFQTCTASIFHPLSHITDPFLILRNYLLFLTIKTICTFLIKKF